jgi:hypothetical protein
MLLQIFKFSKLKYWLVISLQIPLLSVTDHIMPLLMKISIYFYALTVLVKLFIIQALSI